MKRKVIIVILILSHITVSVYAQQEKVDITYVGNAGFLINIGGKKILIDALFKGFEGNYEVPLEVQDKLAKAQAPFDDVDLILVTHAHGDHIDLDMVRQYMQNNPEAVFASTQQLVDAMDGAADRFIGFSPTKEKPQHKEIDGINIETYYLPHGPDSKIINIGFLISVKGVTVFQTGDADFDQFTFDEFRALKLHEKKIDLALIQHYYLRGDSLNTKYVKEAIGGKYIFPIHYQYTTPAFDASIVKSNFPNAIIFDEELQSWKMPEKNNKIPGLSGYYFNQQPPGDSAVVFAPGIISTDSTIEHGSPTFSPDGKEVFWQSNYRKDGEKTQINCMTIRREVGQWTTPEISPYGSGPVFSPDGKRLYYNCKENKGTICFIEKEGKIWSKPKNLGFITRFPKIKFAYNLSFTENGTLYFLGYDGGSGTMNDYGIYRSELVDGVYTKPELLPPSINKAGGVLNWTPFISPDESYLLFSSSRFTSETDYGDIYISFRNIDGNWTNPVCLDNKINSNRQERFPTISPDGKYLFFSRWIESGNEDVMWVSTSIIDELK